MGIKSYISNLLKNKRTLSHENDSDFEDAVNYAWLCREHEIHAQSANYDLRSSRESIITLGDVLSHLLDVKKTELSVLYINEGGKIDELSDPDQICNTDLLKPYVSENKPSSKHVFYNLIYRSDEKLNELDDKSLFPNNGSIMINTTYGGKYKDHSIYLNVTLCVNNPILFKDRKNKMFDPNSLCRNFSIAYDFKKGSQAKAEYEFIKEAIESKTNMEPSSLSQKEWSLLKHIQVDLGSEYYWGKKAFADKRYMDAILYFENVYHSLCSKWYKKGLSNKEMSLLTECSFLIGFSYNDLKLYDKAYHYLELAGRSNSKNHKYKKEFINCLVNSKNLLSIIYIDDYLQELKNTEDNDRSDEDYNFFYFLLRRKAYILIEMEQLDDAEYILRRLLEKDPDNEIVLKELAFIQNQKRKEASVSEEREEKK